MAAVTALGVSEIYGDRKKSHTFQVSVLDRMFYLSGSPHRPWPARPTNLYFARACQTQ